MEGCIDAQRSAAIKEKQSCVGLVVNNVNTVLRTGNVEIIAFDLKNEICSTLHQKQ